MPQFAQFDHTGAAPAPVTGWYDTDALVYANLPPSAGLLAVTAAQWSAHMANPSGWAVNAGALVAFTAPAPVPTLAQQAAMAAAAGCQIVSTGTPALNGTYSCAPAAQQNMSSLYNLIQRAGGAAFPAGLTALPFPDAAGGVHIFPTVTDFLAFETAVGGYVLALGLMRVTGTGTLPAQPVTIP